MWYVWPGMKPEYDEFTAWDNFKFTLAGLALIAAPVGLLLLLASLFF